MKRCLSTGNVSSNDQFVTVTNKKANTQRQKINQTSATQPVLPPVMIPSSQTAIDNAINSVLNQADNGHRICGSSSSSSNSISTIAKPCDTCRCVELKAEMNIMINTIAQLSTKVEFLLSFLGLEDDPSMSAVVNQAQAQQSSVTQTSSTSGSQSITLSYANVARPKSTQLSSQMRQAVMSAVYVDLHSKSARANNIIVSGVPKIEGSEDKYLIVELIEKEFNLQPIIKQCKRLGKVVNNKSQNLLVTLESIDHVKTILSDAKQLRKSHNHFVRENVYINADLTKAEASVAYEERCRRRLQRAGRTKQQQQPLQQQHSDGNAPLGVSKPQLNATVPEFQPTTSSPPTENTACSVATTIAPYAGESSAASSESSSSHS